ncbi:MAG: hypothetical protein AAF642_01415 [Pseudomonadota bacterium]
MRWIVIALGSIWLPLAAQAACSSIACDDEYIAQLYVSTNSVLIDVTGDKSALDCDLISDKFIRLRNSHENYNEIYALLLATQSADRRLGRLRIDSSESFCIVAYAYQLRSNVQN